ncbi:MAG: TOBE domain-containing protein, partial [Coleofasciculaceae cyanobacterium]
PLLIQHPQFRLTLPEVWEPILQRHNGRTLTLGIRPEHLSVAVPAPKNLNVVVELVEALGNDTYLSASLTETSILQVRIPPEQIVKIGDRLWLSIAVDKIHLFDPQTGIAIHS